MNPRLIHETVEEKRGDRMYWLLNQISFFTLFIGIFVDIMPIGKMLGKRERDKVYNI